MRDSSGTVWLLDKPPGFGTNQTIKLPDTTALRPYTGLKPKPDTTVKPKPDTTVKPKPDTLIQPKPDTVKCCRN